jgi:anaerobic selenocysteine-containing dehydrogenase
VFADLARRLGVDGADAEDVASEAETLLRIAGRMPEAIGTTLMEHGSAAVPHDGAPIQFVSVMPATADGKADLFPDSLGADALYRYQPDPATAEYPLALISPATARTISSTLGELRTRPAALDIHPDDAAERGIAPGDHIRVFNALGSVECVADLSAAIARGTVCLPKGLWRRSTLNGLTANALAPDTLTDHGGGACFNDARVQVALLGRH